MNVDIVPEDWPLAAHLCRVAETAATRLGMTDMLAGLELVVDDVGADERGWLRIAGGQGHWVVTLWLHPDHVLQDRPGRGATRSRQDDWKIGPVPPAVTEPQEDEFSAPNAQRHLYQQLLLADDIIQGRLDPAQVPTDLLESFQEIWLTTINGRLSERGLPHSSAGERRASFLRLFSQAGIVTPAHWALFNEFWEGVVGEQEAILRKIRRLPPLTRRPRL